jgi:hypothetical protein
MNDKHTQLVQRFSNAIQYCENDITDAFEEFVSGSELFCMGFENKLEGTMNVGLMVMEKAVKKVENPS